MSANNSRSWNEMTRSKERCTYSTPLIYWWHRLSTGWIIVENNERMIMMHTLILDTMCNRATLSRSISCLLWHIFISVSEWIKSRRLRSYEEINDIYRKWSILSFSAINMKNTECILSKSHNTFFAIIVLLQAKLSFPCRSYSHSLSVSLQHTSLTSSE